ncbi:MAG: DUF4011 domain-containing protein [Methanomassiliicoccaceae archaeon]|jgi:hypothetical protein|nr:DUF4011 domain-containing protein [Methanomassiliicoccaceae archaeon]
MGIILEAVVSPAISAATQENIPVIKSLVVGNDSDGVVEDIKIVIRPDPLFANVKMINVRSIGAHEKVRIKNADLVPVDAFLSELKGRIAGTVMISVEKDNEKLIERGYGLTILTEDEWYGTAFPEMTSSFVTPDDPDVLRITGNAAKLLHTWTGNAAMDRYASSDRARVKKEVSAIYGAMQQFDIKGSAMPADWRKGCRISSANKMIDRNTGTQFDLTLLMVSCAESVGLNPVMIFTKKSVTAAIWTDDTTFSETVQTDIALLAKHIRDGSLMLVDCEGVTSNKRMDIEMSETSAKRSLLNEADFLFALDIKCSRGNARPASPKMRDKTAAADGKDAAAQKSSETAAKVPDTAPAMNELSKRERWEKCLLDLSFGNELLSMRMDDTLLPIMTNNLAALKDALTNNEVRILGRPAEWDSYILNEAPFEVSKYVGRHEVLIEQEFRNKTLRSPYNEKEVDKRLTNMHRISKNDAENCENSLYFVFGILKWHDANGRVIYAPLALVPAEAVAVPGNGSIRVRVRDDDPVVNRTLLEKIRRTYGIDIPADPLPTDRTGADTEKLFRIVKNSIRTIDGADIIEGAFIGIFRPERYGIWNDLRSHSNALFSNKLTKSLMEGKLAWDPISKGDDHKRLMLIYEADASQRNAVRASASGTFVMRMPPGTKKIRTICNMVSDAIYGERSVLVISEKDVVLRNIKQRMDDAGIGKYCLRLHSGNADKRKMLDQLRSVTDHASDSYVPEFQAKADVIEKMHRDLSGPVRSLHRMTDSGMTPYEIILQYDKVKDKKTDTIEFPEGLVNAMDPGSVERWTVLVKEMIIAAKALGHPSAHPLSNIGMSEFGANTKDTISDTLAGWIDSAEEAEDAASRLTASVKVDDKRCDLIGLASSLLALNDIPKDVLGSDPVSAINDKIRELLASVRQSFDLLNNMRKRFDMNASDENIASLEELHERMTNAFDAIHGIILPDVREDVLEHYIADILDAKDKMRLSSALLERMRTTWKDSAISIDTNEYMEKWNSVNAKKLLSGASKKMFIRELAAHLKDTSVPFDSLYDMLGVVEGYVSTTGLLKKSLTALDVLGGGTYSPIRNDCDALEKIYDAVDSRLDSLNGYGNADAICKRYADSPDVQKHASRYLALSKELSQRRRSVGTLLGVDISRAAESDDLKGWKKLCEKWMRNIDRFEEIASWNKCRSSLEKEGIACVADAYEKGMKHDSVMTSFNVSLMRYLRDSYISRSPSLSSFNSKMYDNSALKFRDAAEEFIHYSRAELAAAASSRVAGSSASPAPDLASLRTAISTSGRGMTIRGILGSVKDMFRLVSPCMLMSPPAVSKYLGHDVQFDLVIVDAAQMPTHRAVDAITRGKAVVIIGDDKQTPPKVNDKDREGIMNDCLSVQVPRCDPEWSYRPEDLAEFTNSAIYGKAMGTFPPASKRVQKISVTYVSGRYDRNLRQNEAEAEAVVKETVRLFRERKERSVGIVAFSEGQRDIIEGLVAKAAAKDAQIASAVNNDSLFVRCADDAQGHQRDIAVISLGIGKDPSGKLPNDLPPFSRANGEKRLNTALMCADREAIVFSSLRPSDIAVTEETAEGVRTVKELLEYADGKTVSEGHIVADDEICGQVAKAITERGYTVRRNIGKTIGTVDIGVVDPQHPDAYILGILLDSGPFMRSDAFDSEFVFRNMLARNGWALHRVWTTDWLNGRDAETENIAKAIEKRIGDTERWNARPPRQRKFDVKVITKMPASAANVTKRCVRKQYVKAELEEKTMSLEALFSNSSRKMIERDIRAVVNIESPVADTVAAQRLADAYGIRNAKLTEHIITMIASMNIPSTATPLGGRILWKDADDISSYNAYRVPAEGGERDMNEVAAEEIINAVADIVFNSPGISVDDAVAKAANIFDDRGVTDEAKFIITACIGTAISEGTVRKDGNGNLM